MPEEQGLGIGCWVLGNTSTQYPAPSPQHPIFVPAPIEHYALVGDCEAAALVALDGSIDWLCWPRFDSPACFSALLGSPEHGHWIVTPVAAPTSVTRRYRGDSMVLETRFETPEGACTLVDFMPVRGPQSDLIRMVIG